MQRDRVNGERPGLPLSGPLQPRLVRTQRLGQHAHFGLGQLLLRCLSQQLGQLVGAALDQTGSSGGRRGLYKYSAFGISGT